MAEWAMFGGAALSGLGLYAVAHEATTCKHGHIIFIGSVLFALGLGLALWGTTIS